jgi:tripartite-type tricarboxylate transporter receptor subunit TctC
MIGRCDSNVSRRPEVLAGRRRASKGDLGLGCRTRVPLTESGYNDFEMNIWFGIVASAKTSKETLDQLGGWFTSAMAVSDVCPKLAVQGLYPDGRCGADFGAFLRQQYDDCGRAIREANMKAE